MEKKTTARGFAYYNFIDRNGHHCKLQKSSVASEDAIWLGTEGEEMHLNKEHIVMLLPVLSKFVETGEL